MAVIRVNKTKNYTVMSNYHLRDKRLSLKAKGLLSVMLSLPETWDYSIAGLVSICKENTSAVKSALEELKENGYLCVTKEYPTEDNGGRITYIYDVFEKPNDKQPEEKQEHDGQGLENLCVETQPVENKLQYNTNQSNTDRLSTDKERKNNNTADADFDSLWLLYPRKEGKKQALSAYKRAIKAGVSVDTIRKGIEAYISYIQREKVKPQYIKMGSTWFNGECWNDDYGQHIVGMYNDHELDDVF